MSLVSIGEVLAGKYRVEKILGIGGMGMVVAATHLELDQKVALKFMLPEAMVSATAMDRFLREARAAVRLRSEHICRVLDVGRLDNNAPYIVMEFMEGQDFAHVIEARGQLPVVDAIDYVMQAMEGLAEAHSQGIVHRDLKPGNLFVTTENDGSPLVKVLDFGISKSSLGGAATKTGDVMGSPAYMAPEQMASSKNVDARADIWALGVILYQAITHALPFEGDTLPALCMSVLNATPPSPTAIRADLPPALAEVVMTCLAKSPDGRYASVAELAAALAPFGSAEAASGAARIAKVLRRTSTGPAASLNPNPTPVPGSLVPPTIAATQGAIATPITGTPVTSTPVSSPAKLGTHSTLQASASEIETRPQPGKSRLGLYAGAATAVIAGIVIVVMATRGGSEPAAATAPPSPAMTAPTPPPDPPRQATAPNPAPAAPSADPTPAPAPALVKEPEPPPAAPAVATKPAASPTKKPGAVAKPTTKTDKPVTSPADVATKPVEKPAETKPTEKPAEIKPAVADTKPAVADTKPEPKPADKADPKPTSKWTKMQHDKKP